MTNARRRARIRACVFAGLCAAFATGTRHAQAGSPSPDRGEDEPLPAAHPAPPTTPHFVGTFDTLGLLEGRYGAQVEWLPAHHLGVAAYAWWEHSIASGTPDLFDFEPDYTYSTETHAFGLDTQFRYYFRDTFGQGFFVAPGLEIQNFDIATQQGCGASYSYDTPGASGCPTFPSSEQRFTYVGLSFDLGVQWILPIGPTGFAFGASVGAQARAVIAGAFDQSNMPWNWSLSDGPGITPRARLSIGWTL